MDTGTAGWSWPATEDNAWARARDGPDDRSNGSGGPRPGSGQPGSGQPGGGQPGGGRQAGAAGSRPEPQAPQPEPAPAPPRHRPYRPRTCRICLEVVGPTIVDEPEGIGAFLRREPRVRYESPEEDGGRLFSPCKCKGSQKYVHEGCLQAWRNAGPRNDRNSWKCPTCGFEYKLERLVWGRMLSRPLVRVSLTLSIMVLTVFLLGFVGDTVIDLWLDPFGTIQETVMGDGVEVRYDDDEEGDWLDHFLKGFLSLGLLGFVKTLWTMNPIYYWMNRGRARQRGGGRDRIEGLNLAVVIVGVFTFLGVRYHPSSLTAAADVYSLCGKSSTTSPTAPLARFVTGLSTFRGTMTTMTTTTRAKTRARAKTRTSRKIRQRLERTNDSNTDAVYRPARAGPRETEFTATLRKPRTLKLSHRLLRGEPTSLCAEIKPLDLWWRLSVLFRIRNRARDVSLTVAGGSSEILACSSSNLSCTVLKMFWWC